MAAEVQERDQEAQSPRKLTPVPFSQRETASASPSEVASPKKNEDADGPHALQEEQAPERARQAPSERKDDGVANDDKRDTKSQKGFLRAHPMGTAIGALLLVLVAAGGLLYWDNSRHFQSTDDAFIAARQYAVAPKVSGYITAVPVTDNQHVVAGDVVARIDPRDYQISLEQAKAQVASAQASITNVDAQMEVQRSQIDASQAQVDQGQAGLLFAQQQAARYEDLAKTGSGTVQNAQQFSSQLRQAQASLQSAQANLKVAQRTLESLKAQRESAVASLAQAEAQRDQAQLNLSYTTVTAAEAGRVTNLTGAVGQYAQQGTALTMFVPDQIWVTANYKETQLDAMRPGQPVTLRIDAYPGRIIRGHVASVQSGSGTAFSLLPAQNATGNYVKIVQRVPVKIVMDNPPDDVALGPGMSVVPSVRVDPAPSVYERLRARL